MTKMNLNNLENRVRKTIAKYRLLKKNDKVIVAISGGKDSTLIAFLLKKFGYRISALHINLHLGPYTKRCMDAVKKFCSENRVPLHIYDIRKNFGCSICYLRAGIQSRLKVKNCAICGVIKKWILNRRARELKADKIVTGHNLDDESQTALMNLFKGNVLLGITTGPVSGIIQDKKFVPRIKPLFFIPEEEIKQYARKMNLPVVYEKCPCALDSYRIKTREFVNLLGNKDKLRIVKNNLKIIERLREKIKNDKVSKIAYCKICEEPARGEICKRCSLLKNFS